MTDYEKLIQYALRILAKKRYTAFEIKKKLELFEAKQEKLEQEKNGNDTQKEATIKAVLERLFELRYLDDSGYAEDYISDRQKFKPRGKFLLARELKNKGAKTESQFWVMPLSPRRESELMQSTESEIDFLFHSLEKNIREEDFIFLTAPAQTSQRLLAVYKVKKTGQWHPYIKNQGLLERIHRFSKSLYMPSLESFFSTTF